MVYDRIPPNFKFIDFNSIRISIYGHLLNKYIFGVDIYRLLSILSKGLNNRFKKNLLTWRREIKIGDIVNARDFTGRWCEGKIVGVSRGMTLKKKYFCVRFRHWNNKWNENYALDSLFIQPAGWKVKSWYKDFNLKIGTKIEVRKNFRWHEARIITIDKRNVLLVFIHNNCKIWKDMESEDICPLGTHISKYSIPHNLKKHLRKGPLRWEIYFNYVQRFAISKEHCISMMLLISDLEKNYKLKNKQ
tara:strand:- start:2240 stop:2977 length:738 start_codon:yes stop_codon:yes gene_type:complete